MIDTECLKNILLVASPALHGSIFEHAVIYLYEHSTDGAIGVIINKPVQVNLYDVLKQTSSDIAVIDKSLVHEPVLLGGTTQQDRGLILYSEQDDTIDIAASLEMLDNIAKGEGPERRLVVLGYCGWSDGQLENEIEENLWLLMPVTTKIIFDLPVHERWSYCCNNIGIKSIDTFSGGCGHA